MSASISERASAVKELFFKGEYEEAAKIIILVELLISELIANGDEKEAKKIESEISNLKKSVFEKAIAKATDDAKNLIAKKDSGCVLAVLKAEKFAEGTNKTPALEKLKNEAYRIGTESKLAECKNYLKNGNFDGAYKAYKTAEIFGDKIGKDAGDGKILSEIYTGLCKSEIEAAKKGLNDKNINCVEKIFVAEKYAEKAENTLLSKEVAELKKNILKFGVEAKTEEAKNLSKKDPVKALVAILSAEQYASQANIATKTEQLKKEIYENLIRVKFDEVKANLKNNDYKSALSALAVIRNSEKTGKIKKIDGKIVLAEVENLQKKAYNVAVENLISEGKNAIKKKDHTTALANCNLTGIYATKLNITVDEVENLRKDAYKIACQSKINEAKELLNKGDADGYAALNVATSYAKKANIPVPEEIEKLKPKAHEVFANYKFNAAKETLESDPSDSVVAILLTEKHAKLANVKLPADFESVKNKAYNNGINAKIKDAEDALKTNDYEGAIGPLSVAKSYAEKIKVKVPAKVEELRKKAYAIGVNAKIADVKQALADNDYGAAVGGCNVVDLFAGRAEIKPPKELADLRLQGYKLAAEEKLKEAKETIKTKEYSDAFGALAGVEIYSKKANIEIPKEVEELRKNAYKIACYSKIDEAKELLNNGDADGYAALNVATSYAKKANIPVPEEIEKLKPKAHEVFANYKFNAAKETLETDPGDSVVALLLTEKHAKLANVQLPADFESVKKKAYNNGINAKIKDAEDALKANDYEGAIGPLSVARSYAEKIKVKVPAKVEEIRKKAYAIGVNAKIADVKQALADKDYGAAVGGCNVVDLFAGRAEIKPPKELADLRLQSYKLAAEEKLKEAKETIKTKEYSDAFGACAGVEIYSKKANIEIPKEVEELRKNAYKIACYSKIDEAKELLNKGDADGYAALNVATSYAKKANMQIPDEIEKIKPKAHEVFANYKFNAAKETLETDPGDSVVALLLTEKHAKLANVKLPADFESVKNKTYTNGINAKIKDAEDALKTNDYEGAIGPLSVAKSYAEKIKLLVPAKVEELRKKAYSIGVNAKIADVKQALADNDYGAAVGGCNVVDLFAGRAEIKPPKELENLRLQSYKLAAEEKLKEAKETIKTKEYSDAFGALAGVEIYSKKANIAVPKEVEELRKNAHEVACYSKIDEAKELLNKGDADGYAALNVAEAYSKKANMQIPDEIEKIKPKAHEVFANYKFNAAKETLETDPGDSVVALLLTEKHAKLANVQLPADFESVKNKAYTNGINAKIKDAEDALKTNDYEGAIGPLSVAKSYAEKIKLLVPAKVEELRKKAYSIGVNAKIADVKQALADNDYGAAVGGCNVVDLFAGRAEIKPPKELENLRLQSYKLAAEEKLKEAKETIKTKEYSDAFGALAGVEIYSKKANMAVPKEVEELRKNAYEVACYSKIDEAKELLNKGDADGYAALNVAEAYSKKANMQIPDELGKLKPKAHEVFANYKFNAAKETLETDPGDSVVALLLTEKHAKLANVQLPADFESVKNKAYTNGINAKIKDAEDALKTNDYEGAIGPLSVAKSYAEKIKLPVPAKVEELRKKAYSIGVNAKIADVKQALADNDYGAAVGGCNVVDLFAGRAEIKPPKELENLRLQSYKLAAEEKLKEAKETIKTKEYSDAFGALAGVEIYSKKANIEIPKEVEELRKNAYEVACYSKIDEAKELLNKGDADGYAALNVAEAYSKKANMQIPAEIEKIKPKAHEVFANYKFNAAKETLETDPGDSVVALLLTEKHAKLANVQLPADFESVKNKAYTNGINAKIKDAEDALKTNDYEGAIGPLSVAKSYAEKIKVTVPEKVEELRKKAYAIGVNAKIADVKQALVDKDYGAAVGGCDVVDLFAGRAGISAPKELSDLRLQAYKLAAEEKLKEAKETIKTKEYSDAFGALAGVEIYSKKANIAVPKEVEELRKNAYEVACYSKIDEAKELLNKGDADGYAALNVAEAYSKKANMQIPDELGKLKPKAHEVFANYKFNAAKETLETDPGDSVVALLLTEKHAKLANVQLPADFESVKNKAYTNGINAKIKDAEDALKTNDYEGAIGPLSVAKSYAEKIKLPVPAKVEELRKKAYSIGVNAKIADVKQALVDKDYGAAVGGCDVVDLFAGRAGISAPKELSDLRLQAYKLAAEEKLKEARETIKTKEYSDAFGALAGVEIYSKKANMAVPKEVEELRKNAYEVACYSKIDEAKELLNKGDADGYAALNVAEAYSKKANMQIPDELGKLKPKAHEVFANYKFNAAKETLETDPGDSVVALLLTEKHAKLANVQLPADFESVKNKAYTNGINAKIKDAEDALKTNDYEGAIGPLSVAKSYAEKSNIKVPAKVEELRKKAYSIGVNAKIADVGQALMDRDYGAAVGGCNVVDLFAGRAGINVPKELSGLRLQSYRLAAEEKLKEAKEAVNNKEYSDAFGACAGVEIYSRKANIEIPKEVEELRKNAYEIACYLKINEAKELLNKGDADGYAALNTAEAYSKKANMAVPKEIDELTPKAHEVFANYKFNAAKETLETDPGDSVVNLSLTEKHTKLANVPLPADFESVKNKAYNNGINAKIKDAEDALKTKDYEGAIGPLSVARSYAEKLKIEVPSKIEELRKNAYSIGVNAKIGDVKQALADKDYGAAVGGCNVVDLFAGRAGIDVPTELGDLRMQAYNLAITEKLKEGEEGIKHKDYSEVFASCAGAEIYGRKANVDVKKEFPDINSMWTEGYKLAYYAKLNEAKDLMSQNDSGCYAALKSAEKYAENAGMQLPDMMIDSLKKDAYKVVINSKESDINKAINECNYGDAIAAFNGLTYYTNLSGLSAKEEPNQLKKKVLNLGIESKLKEANEAYNSGDFASGLSALSIAEAFANTVGVSAAQILEERKKITVAFLNAKIAEIDKFLNEGNFDDAITALRGAERQSARMNVPFPEKLTEISKNVYETGVNVKIKGANEALSAGNFGDGYVSLENAKEFANKTGKSVPEIDVLKKKCFEIGTEEKIKSAKKNIAENNYEDAIADIIAANGYAAKAGKTVDVSDLEKQAYKIGIYAQTEELKKAINNKSYDDSTLAYYTIKSYVEKISTNIPPEVDTLMLDVYKLGYEVKQKEAINHATGNEFTEAIGCLKEVAYCAEKSGTGLSSKFEEMQKEIYTDGIKAKLKNAFDALSNGEYLETLGNLKVAEAYSKELRLNFSQIARDAGFDVKKIIFEAYMTGIKKNLEVARKAADRGERYDALSAAAIVSGYANTLEIDDPQELASIIAEVEGKK